jgi:hypothetical protein
VAGNQGNAVKTMAQVVVGREHSNFHFSPALKAVWGLPEWCAFIFDLGIVRLK